MQQEKVPYKLKWAFKLCLFIKYALTFLDLKNKHRMIIPAKQTFFTLPFQPASPLLDRGHIQSNTISWSQNQTPHLQALRILRSLVFLEGIHAQQAAKKNLHLSLSKLAADTPSRTLQKSHESIRRVCRGQIVPSVRIN
jgi:hypothetical protein